MDVTGGATIALAIATFVLAGVTAVSVFLQQRAVRRGFEFERVRQVPLVAPILSVGVAKGGETPEYAAPSWYLAFTNSGLGPACNPRFSSLYNGETLSAAADLLPPLGPGESFTTRIAIKSDTGGKPYHFDQLVIRYDDVFGNMYSTEYLYFDAGHRDYTWRRPWVGKDFDTPKPRNDSADPPEWGSSGREYVDAEAGRI